MWLTCPTTGMTPRMMIRNEPAPMVRSVDRKGAGGSIGANLLRTRRVVRPIDAVHVEIDGKLCTNFCSNNYLGLTHHPRVIEATRTAAAKYGAGSGASALISGYTTAHAAAELAVARWKGTESALLFPSGYQANVAAIQAICAVGESGAGGGAICHRQARACLAHRRGTSDRGAVAGVST